MTAVRMLLLGLAFAATTAGAVERFPPPDFESHALPTTTVPPPRAVSLEYLDTAVLAAALGLAAWLALRRRSRAGLVALGLFSLAYFGFWRKGCICPVGSVQNVALALFDSSYALPLTVAAFFLLPLVFALFFGRVFCAAVCPLGMIQDIVILRPVRVPGWLDQPLRLLPVVYLGLAVLFAATGAAFAICQYDPFVSFFRLNGRMAILALGAGFLIIGVFIGRPYCRYFCPYGVLLAWVSAGSKWHVTITPDECIRCRLCEDACPFDAIRKPTPDWSGMKRRTGKPALLVAMLLFPLLALAGGWLGGRLGQPLARVHRTVQLADRIWLENVGRVEGTTVASDTFRATGRSESALYRDAVEVQRRFSWGARLFGAFVGAVLGGKLIRFSVRRRQEDYEADRTTCLSCGRCFMYCPRERLRRKQREGPSASDSAESRGPARACDWRKKW